MTTAYEDELENKNFKGNVVVLLAGRYYSKHKPDSGLPLSDGSQALFNFNGDALELGGSYTLSATGTPKFSASPVFEDGQSSLVCASTADYYRLGAGLNTWFGGRDTYKIGMRVIFGSIASGPCLFTINSTNIFAANVFAPNTIYYVVNGTAYTLAYSFVAGTEYYIEFGLLNGDPFVFVDGVTVQNVAGANVLGVANGAIGVFLDGIPTNPFVGSMRDLNIAGTFSGTNYPYHFNDTQKMIGNLTISPVLVDPRNAKTTIRSYNFSIVDKDLNFTKLFRNNESSFMGETVRIFLGRITGSFDFSDYYELPHTQLTQIGFAKETFNFKTQEAVNLMRFPIFNETAPLRFEMADTFGLSVTATGDITGFPATGTLKIDDELMTYTAKNDTTGIFTLDARGALGSEAVTHSVGATIYKVVRLAGNPLTIFLQMMLTGTYVGNVYDVLPEGMGIAPSLIDIAEIEYMRDNSFSGIEFDFYLYGIQEFLKWAEEEIFLPCNIRLVMSSNGKISLKLLDDISFQESTKVLDSDSVIASSVNYSVTDQKVINVIEILYDYNPATGEFESKYTDFDQNSVDIYGERKTYSIPSKGIKTSLGGDAFSAILVRRLLARHSTATPEISLQAHFDKSLALPGEIIRLNYNLPSSNGDRDFQNDLEIMQAGLDEGKGLVSFNLAFTAYTGLRNGYISPTDLIVSVVLQKIITVASGRGTQYRVGWKMRLSLPATGQTADAVNEIADITGDTITFVDDFSTILTTAYRVEFANYDEASEDQLRYAFASLGAADFADGKSPYLVSF